MERQPITSTSNPRAKAWASLSKRSERSRTGTFLIEGRREVERMRAHVDVVEVIWCEAYADTAGDDVTSVSAAVFDRLSRRQSPDGWAAVARTPDLSLTQFRPDAPELVLVADGIEKPGNLGAILRTCDALGAAFLGSDLGTDLVNPNTIRAAQGSLFAVPTASTTAAEAAAWCAANTEVFVTRPGASMSLWNTDLRRPTSIVIGSEDDGVGSAWDGVGVSTVIPMQGAADSLNASVSAAVLLAEARRQRSIG